MTRGSLSWLVTIPPDGNLLLGGAAPALIQWSGAHPAATLPDAGCWLEELTIRHAQTDWLEAFLRDVGFGGAVVLERPTASHQAGLSARIRTPGGVVLLGGP